MVNGLGTPVNLPSYQAEVKFVGPIRRDVGGSPIGAWGLDHRRETPYFPMGHLWKVTQQDQHMGTELTHSRPLSWRYQELLIFITSPLGYTPSQRGICSFHPISGHATYLLNG